MSSYYHGWVSSSIGWGLILFFLSSSCYSTRVPFLLTFSSPFYYLGLGSVRFDIVNSSISGFSSFSYLLRVFDSLEVLFLLYGCLCAFLLSSYSLFVTVNVFLIKFLIASDGWNMEREFTSSGLSRSTVGCVLGGGDGEGNGNLLLVLFCACACECVKGGVSVCLFTGRDGILIGRFLKVRLDRTVCAVLLCLLARQITFLTGGVCSLCLFERFLSIF